jgi:sodium/potassium/calcium exchanger 6
LFSLLGIILIFRFMAILAEDLETPALLKISEYLKMDEILASVTLLALANGAGDVLTSVASGGEEGDIGLVLSTLYGSGLFV